MMEKRLLEKIGMMLVIVSLFTLGMLELNNKLDDIIFLPLNFIFIIGLFLYLIPEIFLKLVNK